MTCLPCPRLGLPNKTNPLRAFCQVELQSGSEGEGEEREKPRSGRRVSANELIESLIVHVYLGRPVSFYQLFFAGRVPIPTQIDYQKSWYQLLPTSLEDLGLLFPVALSELFNQLPHGS